MNDSALFKKLAFCLFCLSFFSPAFAFLAEQGESSDRCLACHEQANHDWQQSDHQKAMAKPTKQTVKGNFAKQSISYGDEQAYFYEKGDDYFVRVSNKEKSRDYKIQYTFGYWPLQQYLIHTERGKLQLLAYTWDERPLDEGGQRWYHIYDSELHSEQDRFHFLQPSQNHNGMCADCHSQGLVRNYTADTDTFATTYADINVGCLSCHGNLQEHYPNSDEIIPAEGKIKHKPTPGYWFMAPGSKNATWQGEPRDNSFMDDCFACHSLRSPLTDGFKAGKGFLQQFRPQLPTPPLYHVDGQIKEEVYVYASFTQSKMHTAGVNCLDCHDKHTMKVKTLDNGLCLQCHNGGIYQQPAHLNHQLDNEGSQCVNCHMPETTYMEVDDRRDHSFSIPRPAISEIFDTPNACNRCHDDQSNRWSSDWVAKWYPEQQLLTQTEQNYLGLMANKPLTKAQHLAIIADTELPVMKRATALYVFSLIPQPLTDSELLPYLQSSEDLLRYTAALATTPMADEQKIRLLTPLIKDPVKLIRVTVADLLAGIQLPANIQANYQAIFEELLSVNEINAWRGEGRINKATLAQKIGDWQQAELELKQAIAIDPYFEVGYLNLADQYRLQGNNKASEQILLEGMQAIPSSGFMHYSYALFLIRSGDKQQALGYLQKASELEPGSVQFLYAYALSLNELGQGQKAVKLLIKNKELVDANRQLAELLKYLVSRN